MYNLTVDTVHTFFVGDGQWLVHNDSCDPALRALANTANDALKQLPDGPLRVTTVAATTGNNGKPLLALYNKTVEGTQQAIDILRQKKWNVLNAPVGRGPDFHAERQLADKGYTQIGISRKQGMCDACTAWFKNRPWISVWPFGR